MKREAALKALDDALGNEMGLMISVLVTNITSRDGSSLEKFSNGLSSLIKAYDGASKIIAEKLNE